MAVALADKALHAQHPELQGRKLSGSPQDAALRKEWLGFYSKAATKTKPPVPKVIPNKADGTKAPDENTMQQCSLNSKQNSAEKIKSYNEVQQSRAIKSASFNVQQNNKDTCALMSIRSLMIEVHNENLSEGDAPQRSEISNDLKKLLSLAETSLGAGVPKGPFTNMIELGEKSRGYVACIGTFSVKNILETAGFNSSTTNNPSINQIASQIDAGKGVFVGIDARPVWYGYDDSKWVEPKVKGHCIRVTGVYRGVDGSVQGFYINDTGNNWDGIGSGRYISADVLRKSLDNLNGGEMTVTNSAIQEKITP